MKAILRKHFNARIAADGSVATFTPDWLARYGRHPKLNYVVSLLDTTPLISPFSKRIILVPESVPQARSLDSQRFDDLRSRERRGRMFLHFVSRIDLSAFILVALLQQLDQRIHQFFKLQRLREVAIKASA